MIGFEGSYGEEQNLSQKEDRHYFSGVRALICGAVRHGTAQDNAGESGAAKPGETDAASTENTAPAETNPYVNEDGQLIDPDTGELITEDSDGFETPVSGILGGSGEAGNADAAGGAENPE